MPVRLFVPGRLCLFGEHSDWAGAYRAVEPTLVPGRCLVAGIDQGIVAEVERRADAVEFATALADGTARGPVRWPASVVHLAAIAGAGEFFSYVAGVAAEAMSRHDVRGITIDVVASNLPIARGLSSSAAISVLVARAYNQLYDLGLSVRDEMDLAYAGERRTGSACGRMDQICALGRRPTLLTFDGDDLAIEPLVAGATFALLVVDLHAGKDTRRILADLHGCFPSAPGSIAHGVRHALGPLNTAIVAEACDALTGGDAPRLGQLMTEAQHRFDTMIAPVCAELRAPRLHQVLAHPAIHRLAWGAKGVGSQGDGAAQIVTRGPAERDALATLLTAELGVSCLAVTIGPSGAEPHPLQGSKASGDSVPGPRLR